MAVGQSHCLGRPEEPHAQDICDVYLAKFITFSRSGPGCVFSSSSRCKSGCVVAVCKVLMWQLLTWQIMRRDARMQELSLQYRLQSICMPPQLHLHTILPCCISTGIMRLMHSTARECCHSRCSHHSDRALEACCAASSSQHIIWGIYSSTRCALMPHALRPPLPLTDTLYLGPTPGSLRQLICTGVATLLLAGGCQQVLRCAPWVQRPWPASG